MAIVVFIVLIYDFFSFFGATTAYTLYSGSRQAVIHTVDNAEVKGKVFLYTSKGVILAENRAHLSFFPFDQIISLRYVQGWDWVRTSPKFRSPPWARGDLTGAQ